MPDEKRITFGVSINPSFLAVVDAHLGDEDRSSYIRRLITADLSAAGKLPGTPEAEAMARARDLISTMGAENFCQLIKTAAAQAA